jgi:peptidoglycan/xylan/chitin deacetylase (PgdA/CDA1 family)
VTPPPVLCYHRIGGARELGVTRVSPAVFTRQMTALARAGWKTLSLTEFAAFAGGPTSLPPHVFFLSFDDGYAELAEHAYPVLADLGFTATTFLITDFVGGENRWDVQYTRGPLRHLDWDTVETWQARGFTFGSHTATHERLTWVDDARARDELLRSRGAMIARLGAAAGTAVAYPFGAVDARIARHAGEAGYTIGFAGVRGDAEDVMVIPRVPVYVWDVGDVPFGLRSDGLGALGRIAAYVANRCAVGTTVLQAVRRSGGQPVK